MEQLYNESENPSSGNIDARNFGMTQKQIAAAEKKDASDFKDVAQAFKNDDKSDNESSKGSDSSVAEHDLI